MAHNPRAATRPRRQWSALDVDAPARRVAESDELKKRRWNAPKIYISRIGVYKYGREREGEKKKKEITEQQ